MTTQTPDAVREALEPLRKLFDAAEGQWPKTPWKLIPSDGKPIIASERGGNLFRGYIATWQEAELVVGIVNALPAILAALDSRAGDAVPAGEVERLRDALKAARRWLDYEASPMGPAETKLYERLMEQIDAALDIDQKQP